MADRFEIYLGKLFKPVVRFAYRRGWKIQQLLELLKISLLTVAEEDIRHQGTEANVSRLSVATGLHRRDVMRLWRDESPPKTADNLLTKIIGQWQGARRFLTPRGKPRILSFEGRESEFAELVASITQDINSYTILFELERADLVERTDKGLRLKRPAFTPTREDIEQGLQLLTSDVDDLVQAVEENLYAPQSVPNLHIKTEYDNVPREAVPKIRELLINEGAAFHEKMRSLLAQSDRDINPKATGTGRARVAVGAFSFSEDVEEKVVREKKRGNST